MCDTAGLGSVQGDDMASKIALLLISQDPTNSIYKYFHSILSHLSLFRNTFTFTAFYSETLSHSRCIYSETTSLHEAGQEWFSYCKTNLGRQVILVTLVMVMVMVMVMAILLMMNSQLLSYSSWFNLLKITITIMITIILVMMMRYYP